jgi:hypothetical protein
MFRIPSISGLFKWRQFEPEVILLAVGWYLRFSLSYRDVEELLAERGLHADHVRVWRWVQRYAPEVNRRLRSRLKPTNDSCDSDLHPGQGQVALPVSRGGLHWDDHRLPSFGQARCSGGRALSEPKVFWRRTANIDRCSTSITSWNRITGPSSAGSAPVNISGPSGELGVQLQVTRRFI